MSNCLYCPPVHIPVAVKIVPDISTDGLIYSSLMGKTFSKSTHKLSLTVFLSFLHVVPERDAY